MQQPFLALFLFFRGDSYVQLFKLLFVYNGRTAAHKLAGVLDLREGGNITQAVCLADYHSDTVKAYAHSAVRGLHRLRRLLEPQENDDGGAEVR